MTKQEMLGQYMTPRWAAEQIMELAQLTPSDVVLEPCCGDGSFLSVIPADVDALGIDIDPDMAEAARQRTGRTVIAGDCLTVDIPVSPTVVVTNPPYKSSFIKDLISRSYSLLPEEGKAILLVSTHILQTPATVLDMLPDWGVEHWLVPRTLFRRAIRPLSLLKMVKGRSYFRGMALYYQAVFFSNLHRDARKATEQPGQTTWRHVVTWAMEKAGGVATVQELYRLVEPRRPTTNSWWKAKVRQTLQVYFVPVSRGKWTTRS